MIGLTLRTTSSRPSSRDPIPLFASTYAAGEVNGPRLFGRGDAERMLGLPSHTIA
jgi:hypothetical protein